MKKILSSFLLLTLVGCASIHIPNYIQDKNPYKRTFYAQYNEVRETTVQALKKFGWTIEKETEPSLFERQRGSGGDERQILLFTKIRETSLFVGSRYARINVYLRAAANNETEVEIRYLTVTSAMFKSFNSYKNDRAVERIFKHIEEGLNL